MTPPILVQIIGAPVACASGVKDTWRGVARLARTQLARQFGGAVQVDYFDLLDPDCPALPPDSQLPVVLVNGQLFSNGGKIAIPALRRAIQAKLANTAITSNK